MSKYDDDKFDSQFENTADEVGILLATVNDGGSLLTPCFCTGSVIFQFVIEIRK